MRTFSLSAAAFADRMLSWYGENRRLLPWREDPTPYHVWLSEIMLQQTQVQTVIPYYTRFITELPQIADLAHVSEDRLHKLWEGLGYYSRADHLHEAAQILLAEHNGLLPESYSDLLALPGIGPYTAGAIASIAFGERVAAVDGNVLRILSRVTAYDGPINVASAAKPLKELAASLVPAHCPGDFNQSLMDLGATICSGQAAHLAVQPVRWQRSVKQKSSSLPGSCRSKKQKNRAKSSRTPLSSSIAAPRCGSTNVHSEDFSPGSGNFSIFPAHSIATLSHST